MLIILFILGIADPRGFCWMLFWLIILWKMIKALYRIYKAGR